MIPKEYAVTDKKKLTIFATMIAQTEATSVLDAGMLLIRSGAVSRSFEGFSVPENIHLYGMELAEYIVGAEENASKPLIPVCEALYDGFANAKQKQDVFRDTKFDLATMVDLPRTVSLDEKKQLMKWIGNRTSLCLTDDEKILDRRKHVSSAFSYEGETYYIVRFL